MINRIKEDMNKWLNEYHENTNKKAEWSKEENAGYKTGIQ
jgi:hypothetical protein